jgi:hypothetical protein
MGHRRGGAVDPQGRLGVSETREGEHVVIGVYCGAVDQSCACGKRTRYLVIKRNGDVSYFDHCEALELRELLLL